MTRQPVSFLATSNPSMARTFYETIMGLTHVETTPFALVFKDGAHSLRVQIVDHHTPPPYTVYGWQVTNISQQITGLNAKGVSIKTFDHLDQDDLGIWSTPNGDQIAWFKDPSGNILSLTEFKSPPALS